MEVQAGYPPNFDAIARVFPTARSPGVIFTYGDTIFTGEGAQLTAALKAHESVHAQRQKAHERGVAGWWEQYLEDKLFRLEEELLAHRAEYRAFKSWSTNRQSVFQMLDTCAKRLSSSLYGGMISYQQARRMICVDVQR